jgi:hypothetical protein
MLHNNIKLLRVGTILLLPTETLIKVMHPDVLQDHEQERR